MEVEDGEVGGVGCSQLAAVDGVNDGASVVQLDARAHAIAAARPPTHTHTHSRTKAQEVVIHQTRKSMAAGILCIHEV